MSRHCWNIPGFQNMKQLTKRWNWHLNFKTKKLSRTASVIPLHVAHYKHLILSCAPLCCHLFLTNTPVSLCSNSEQPKLRTPSFTRELVEKGCVFCGVIIASYGRVFTGRINEKFMKAFDSCWGELDCVPIKNCVTDTNAVWTVSF